MEQSERVSDFMRNRGGRDIPRPDDIEQWVASGADERPSRDIFLGSGIREEVHQVALDVHAVIEPQQAEVVHHLRRVGARHHLMVRVGVGVAEALIVDDFRTDARLTVERDHAHVHSVRKYGQSSVRVYMLLAQSGLKYHGYFQLYLWVANPAWARNELRRERVGRVAALAGNGDGVVAAAGDVVGHGDEDAGVQLVVERVEGDVAGGHGEGRTVVTVRDGEIADGSGKVLEGLVVTNAAVNDDGSTVGRREKPGLERDARERDAAGRRHEVVVRAQLENAGVPLVLRQPAEQVRELGHRDLAPGRRGEG